MVELLLTLALRLTRNADVRASLNVTLCDVQDWHNGEAPPSPGEPWYGVEEAI